MSPEEKAVIDAAIAWERERNTIAMTHGAVDITARALWSVVRALRESRKPKPRWSVDPGGFVTDGNASVYPQFWGNIVTQGDARKLAERICDLLNEDDERSK